jgi:6-phosphogluconate dehydrogenase
MRIGMVGLGKMGANMSRRLMQAGHEVVVTDLNADTVASMAEEGALSSEDINDLVKKLETPRVVWVMVPAGDPTEKTLDGLKILLSAGDIVIDGGNSNYKDTLRRGESLKEQGIHLVDVGTSGGVWGLAEGYSMMVGGEGAAVEHITPILETLAPGTDKGWGYVGPTSSGHFVKMVHNGIEYGLMQAYAEGFEIMRAKEEFELDMHQIAEIWRYGSVVRSWLLDLAANALAEDVNLSEVKGWVADSGEGRWTIAEAIDLDVPAPVITAALYARFASRQDEAYSSKLLAALRNQFGGHVIRKSE